MNVRLFDWQVKRIRSSKAPGAAIIRAAYNRYKRGDFGAVVQAFERSKTETNVPLESYPVRSRYDIPDSLLREILSLHFKQPDKYLSAEMERQKRITDEMMSIYTKSQFILEKAE